MLSIIICTRNRAVRLQQTLIALNNVKVPSGWRAEVIVVDNASTDQTAAVVQNTKLTSMENFYFYEARAGKANALNSGLAKARGDIIVFADDDVVPTEDWFGQILDCFKRTGCDALVGNIRLAPHLDRPWLGNQMKMYLATMDFTADGPLEMVGANCAIRRAVLERVPQFDPELGPGALGLGEDTLFGHQLVKAGFKIEYAEKAVVVHWPDDSRLLRGEWLNAARQRGRSKAYLLYHWEHTDIRFPRIKSLWFWLKLWLRRILQPPPRVYNEGCPPWELSYVQQLATCGAYCSERLRPRNYARQGLIKAAGHRHSR